MFQACELECWAASSIASDRAGIEHVLGGILYPAREDHVSQRAK